MFKRKNTASIRSGKLLWKIGIALCAILFTVCLVYAVTKFMVYQKDCRLLTQSRYNAVVLSTFPMDTFDKEDFAYFRADTPVMVKPVFSNYKTIRHYLGKVLQSGNPIRVIYLGIDPREITFQEILDLKAAFPETQFEIIPKWTPLARWAEEKDVPATLAAYRNLVEGLMGIEKLRVFSFFAQEWIIADPENYVADCLLTEETARLVYIYTDELHGCDIVPEIIPVMFQNLEELITTQKAGQYTFPDLTQWDVVFLGDSVIGHYTDHRSIPGLVARLSGARTYNCGQGGSTASKSIYEIPTLGDITQAFLTGDLSNLDPESQPYAGLSQWLSDEKKVVHRIESSLWYYTTESMITCRKFLWRARILWIRKPLQVRCAAPSIKYDQKSRMPAFF